MRYLVVLFFFGGGGFFFRVKGIESQEIVTRKGGKQTARAPSW